MKLLLDTCVSPRTRDALAAAGHDAIWTGDWNPDPGDEAILEFAQRESRVLITLDKDFGELVVVFGKPHSDEHARSVGRSWTFLDAAVVPPPGIEPGSSA